MGRRRERAALQSASEGVRRLDAPATIAVTPELVTVEFVEKFFRLVGNPGIDQGRIEHKCVAIQPASS